jgi:hypothetical protein
VIRFTDGATLAEYHILETKYNMCIKFLGDLVDHPPTDDWEDMNNLVDLAQELLIELEEA